MRKGFFPSLLTLLACASSGFAQPEIGPPPLLFPEPAPVLREGNLFDPGPATPRGPRGWVHTEYLNWWMTRGPIGVPLVTTTVGNPIAPTAGAIGDPNTRVLFGNSPVDFGVLYGARVSMGYWFDSSAKWGIEASGFMLGKKANYFSVASDQAGNPFLAVPFASPTGPESTFVIARPTLVVGAITLTQSGAINITSTSRLWGTDFNGVWNAYRGCNWTIDLLAGFRYYDLEESLIMNTAANVQLVIIDRELQTTTVVNSNTTTFDQFNTRNQFYGGQVGSRVAYQSGRWSADLLGQFAVGSTLQTLYTGGGTAVTVNGAPVVPAVPGGLLTRPSNLGNFQTHSFSVVPQVQAKLGYNLTNNIRATIGYDALYWTNVIRPGNQIDHVIGTGPPGDTTRPAPPSNRSDIWAHGISTGLQFRW